MMPVMKTMKSIPLQTMIFLVVAMFAGAFFRVPIATAETPAEPVLVQADMCEAITNFLPVYSAVVFTISQGEIFCYTAFDPVPVQTHIFHKWYKRNTLISSVKLTLNPPKWSSFSSMQLRDGDKGAWRVDISDAQGTIMKSLRFSISD